MYPKIPHRRTINLEKKPAFVSTSSIDEDVDAL
jgi:hypothetical protein